MSNRNDRSLAENALEIVVAFSTAEDKTAAVKSDLIKSVHRARYGARQTRRRGVRPCRSDRLPQCHLSDLTD